MDRKIRTGLAGFGLSGRFFHAPFLASNRNFELTAVLERNRDDSREDYPETDTVRSMDEMTEREDIDLIVITTPNMTHVPYARQALESGKHVVLEKPFTVTFREAEDLIRIADENKRILTVYHNRRYDGDFMTVKKIVENGMLGRIAEYESAIYRYRKESPFRGWKAENHPGAGILYDLGPHLIDQAFVLFGYPDTIWASLNHDHPGTVIDDGFTVFMQYPDFRVLLRAETLSKEGGPRFSVHGENGSFLKYGFDVQEERLRSGVKPLASDWCAEDEKFYGTMNTDINGVHFKGKVETIPGNYHLFYDNLADAINGACELAVKPFEAAKVIQAIEVAHRSFVESRVIPFN